MPGDRSHRSGFVAVVGRPNVGKSTLLNAILGQRIAGVSPWPQTTRRRQMGILTRPGAQIIFLDTPGWHAPKDALGRAMVKTSEAAVREADVALFLADISAPPSAEDRAFAAWMREQSASPPILLVLNKADAAGAGERTARETAYRELLPGSIACVISARDSAGLPDLLDKIESLLPEGPPLFPEDEVTDWSERGIAEDLIREAALRNLRAEVPYGIAVRVEEYKERGERGAFIDAMVYVEREAHKAIVIGRRGSMLKKIGADARRKIEEMSGRRIFLQLRVKVLPGWRNREDELRRLGYLPKE
jgi:GTP-binding protein Era